jgi:predicted translin family RNA/ssDNA-binding protein
MINKQFFQKLKKEYLNYSKERHEIIKLSSDALRQAKQAIFALHRDDYKAAEKLIVGIENIFKKLTKKFKQSNKLQYEGSYQAAVEEYVEAKLLFQFLKTRKVAMIKEINVNLEQYVGGLCDFTGELARRAVRLVTKKQYNDIKIYHQVAEQVIGELNQFNLTKTLRVKYDQVASNLKKLEKILYDISLKDKL